MRVALYARVSTSDQSVERQLRELRSYAVVRGWNVIQEFQEVVSGTNQKRPPVVKYKVAKGLHLIKQGKTYLALVL